VLRAARVRNAGDFWINARLAYILFASAASRDEGIGFFRAAVAARPRAAGAHYDLGLALQDQGKEAEQEYREALRLQPHFSLARGHLAILLAGQNRPAEAEQEYREALRIQPDLSWAHLRLGFLLESQNRAAEAEAEYREALRIKPDLAGAQSSLGLLQTKLGNLLAAQGKSAEAEAEYREALRIWPENPEAHFRLSLLLERQHRPAEAEQEYREALRIRPDYADAHFNLGHLLAGQGRAVEAEGEYREVLRTKPDLPEAHCNLGLALRDQGRFREALEELRRGHELGSRNPRWPHPSAAWVEECRRLVECDALPPAVLGGAAEPADADAALGFASVCQITKRYAAAARLSAVAFAAAPEAVNDPRNCLRYNAACYASLAAAGQGIDAPADEMERPRLRAQALAWLRADLAAWGKLARSDDPNDTEAAVSHLRHSREDADLAGVRDADALDKLPEAERADRRQLWADVDALLAKAAPEKK
jgi:tetratricopeptide (TPR) repeat protein